MSIELGYFRELPEPRRPDNNRPDSNRPLDPVDPECEKHRPRPQPCPTLQSHDHEIEGSVMLAEEGREKHNHRFATVSTQMIPLPHHSHKHAFIVNTDFFDHLHEVAGETGPAIDVGGGKHVHFAHGMTTCNDNHSHDFQFATLIDSPLIFA